MNELLTCGTEGTTGVTIPHLISAGRELSNEVHVSETRVPGSSSSPLQPDVPGLFFASNALLNREGGLWRAYSFFALVKEWGSHSPNILPSTFSLVSWGQILAHIGTRGCKPMLLVSFFYASLQRWMFIATNNYSTLTKTAATHAFISGGVWISCSVHLSSVLMCLHCFISNQNKSGL